MTFGKIVKKTKIDKREVIFRYLKIEDLADLRKLHNDLVEERAYIELQTKMTKSAQLEWLLEKIKKIEDKEGILLVIEEGGKAKGYGLIERFGLTIPAFHIGELNMCLAKDIRRQGYGTHLFLNLMREIKKLLKIKIIFIDIAKPNKAALNFYEKLGFKTVGKIRRGFRYYKRYLDDIILVKYLLKLRKVG